MRTKDLLKKRELVTYLLEAEGVQLSSKAKIGRRTNADDLPLSYAQQRLWFLEQLSGSSSVYNISLPVRISGRLDTEALARALNEIIRRHEVLRASFGSLYGQTLQFISPTLDLPVPLTDLSTLPNAEREEELLRLIRLDTSCPFDLTTGPLLRASLVRLADEEYAALLTMHHIVSDAWSSAVLLKELGLLYEAFAEERPSPLPDLPIQYADYASWQRERLTGDVLEDQLRYWKAQLAQAPARLELPTDHPRPPIQSFRGGREALVLTASLGEALKSLSQREGATLFMTLLAAFQTLLWRYTGQTEIVVGTPIAGRNRAETEPLIGFFVNTLALRTQVRGAENFRELLGRVRETCLGAYAHQDLPFEKLVEELQPDRSLDHTPLFQVMFTLLQGGGASMELKNLRLSPLDIEDDTEKFDLTLFVDESEPRMRIVLGYNIELFEAASIKRMLSHYRQVLQAIVNNPRERLSELRLLSEEEWRQIVEEWNETAVSWPELSVAGVEQGAEQLALHQLFEQQVERTPGAVALSFEGQELSYAELNGRANQLAHHLESLGVGPDQQVGVMMERSLELVISLLAILKAGGAYVPFDPSYPAERLSFMLEDAAVNVLLTQVGLLERLPEAGGANGTVQVVAVDGLKERLDEEASTNPRVRLSGANLAYMIYTSGSTGTPKGAMNTHEAIVNRLLWMQQRYQLGAADVVLQKTPLSFDVSVWEFFWPLLAGARLVVARPEGHRDPNYLVAVINEEQVTTLHFVPAMLQAFLSNETVSGGCGSVRRVICSGEALSVELAEQCLASLPQAELHNLYGPTEAAVDVTAWHCQPGEQRASVPIGRPIANTEIYILDRELQAVPVGVSGDLYIGGTGLARGYHRRAELTAERFLPHPLSRRTGERLYRTGDVARYGADGAIEYLGRDDHQVKIRGYRIELGEIEAVLREHERVQDAVVVSSIDSRGDKRLVGYVKVDGESSLKISELRQYLGQRLPEYMVPQAFVQLAEWPLTPSGKLDRRALPAPELQRSQLDGAYVAPRTPAEEALTLIWSQVLSIEQVGAFDNFFSLGGDSIRSLQVVALARLRGLYFSLQQLFQHQTIAALAAAARQGESETEVPREPSAPFGLISPADHAQLPEGIEDAYPLTMLQAGMLYHMALTPQTPLYHNVNSMRLRAALDMEVLRAAAAMVVERHASLRTGFDLSRYSEPLQVVHTQARMAIGFEDISSYGVEDQERVVDQYIEAEKGLAFDVSQPPLMRFFIHRCSDQTFQFTLTECHPIQDGWSLHTVLAEMFGHYFAELKGEAAPQLDPVTVSYREFVGMEREALASEEHKLYWQRKLEDSTMLELPRWKTADEQSLRPNGAGGVSEVRFRPVRIPRELSDELKDFARTIAVPVKSVMLAAHMKVLSILSGSTDVLTGVVSNGRSEAIGGERTMGLFLNTLPFRQQVTGGTWQDLVRATFDNEWELLPYRRYPMAALQHSRGGELYETAFNFMHFHVVDTVIRSGDVEVLATKASEGTNWTLQTHFSLGLDALQLELQLEYNSVELCDEQMEAIEGYYLSVMRAMARNPLAHHEYQNFLAPAEERQQLEAGAAGEGRWSLEQSFDELFREQVEATPEAVAVVSEGVELSYRELNERANQVGQLLRAAGVGAETVVGLLGERSAGLLIGILGVFKAGAAYMPLDPGQPAARQRQMVEQSGTRLVLASGEYGGELRRALALGAEAGPEIRELEEAWEAGSEWSKAAVEPGSEPEQLAYVIYTSGSTGAPKGAMITQRGMVNHLQAKVAGLGLTGADRVAQTASQSFDISVWQFLGALLVGGQVEIVSREVEVDPRALLRLVAERGVTVMETVPSLLGALVEELEVGGESGGGEGEQLGGLRWLIATGEALAPELCRRWAAVSGATRLLNAYGPTECADDVTHYEVVGAPAAAEVRMPIGRALGNTQLYVLNEELGLLPRGVVGELYVGGAGVGRGYLRDARRTAQSFGPDPYSRTAGARLYQTGDLARYRADGELEYVGRRDQQVKVRGYRIELGEIEAVLRGHEEVQAAVVEARADERGEQRLVGYVVREAGGDGQAAAGVSELRAYLRERLPEYMVPPALVILAQIPLTPNGKIDRKALPSPDGSSAEELETYVAPHTELEQQIARVWQDVLRTEKVGLHDNFFDLGGHSILMIEASSKLRLALNRELSLIDMFRHPTVSAMAEFLDAEQPESITFEDNTERANLRKAAAKRLGPARKRRLKQRL